MMYLMYVQGSKIGGMRFNIHVNRITLIENCLTSCQRITALLQHDPLTISDLNEKRSSVR